MPDIESTLSIPHIEATFAINAAGTVWGSISGDIENQEDLQQALDSKEDVISADNKINSDFIDDTDAVNKFVTTEQIATWDAKQNAITGGASTVITDNLTANRTLVSSAGGKIIVSDTTATELGYVHGVTSNIQIQLNSKQQSINGGASSITNTNLTVNRALISDGNGKVAVSGVTSFELANLSGVTSNIQTQINGKQATISDLDTIRTLANNAIQPNDNITELTNNAGYITKDVNNLTNYTTTSDLNTALGQKQDVITDLSTIRAGAAAGATALQAENYGTIVINI